MAAVSPSSANVANSDLDGCLVKRLSKVLTGVDNY